MPTLRSVLRTKTNMSHVAWVTASVAVPNRLHLLVAAFFCLFILLLLLALKRPKYVVSEQLPLINRRFDWEPRLFARLRWALFAREILEVGYRKVSSISALQYQYQRCNTCVIPVQSGY